MAFDRRGNSRRSVPTDTETAGPQVCDTRRPKSPAQCQAGINMKWPLVIGAGVVAYLVLTGVAKAKDKDLPPGPPQHGDNGLPPVDYPEPPIPGDVMPAWNKPTSGWSKTRPAGTGYIQDSKGWWWNVPRGGV